MYIHTKPLPDCKHDSQIHGFVLWNSSRPRIGRVLIDCPFLYIISAGMSLYLAIAQYLCARCPPDLTAPGMGSHVRSLIHTVPYRMGMAAKLAALPGGDNSCGRTSVQRFAKANFPAQRGLVALLHLLPQEILYSRWSTSVHGYNSPQHE